MNYSSTKFINNSVGAAFMYYELCFFCHWYVPVCAAGICMLTVLEPSQSTSDDAELLRQKRLDYFSK